LTIVLLIIQLVKSNISRHISDIENGFEIVNLHMNILKGFINNASFDIDYLTISHLRGFAKFCMIYYSYRQELVDAINNASKSITLRSLKTHLESQSKLSQGIIYSGYEMFRKYQVALLQNKLVKGFFESPVGKEYLDRFSKGRK
jgi:hypothetical protein